MEQAHCRRIELPVVEDVEHASAVSPGDKTLDQVRSHGVGIDQILVEHPLVVVQEAPITPRNIKGVAFVSIAFRCQHCRPLGGGLARRKISVSESPDRRIWSCIARSALLSLSAEIGPPRRDRRRVCDMKLVVLINSFWNRSGGDARAIELVQRWKQGLDHDVPDDRAHAFAPSEVHVIAPRSIEKQLPSKPKFQR